MRGRFCFASESCELARNKLAVCVALGFTEGTSPPNPNQCARKRQTRVSVPQPLMAVFGHGGDPSRTAKSGCPTKTIAGKLNRRGES
jgi:hypothetical protein